MNFLKFLFIASMFICSSSAMAEDFYRINQKGAEEYGYNKPFYYNLLRNKTTRDQFDLFLIADPDNFPFYSQKQGSVFYKFFSDLMNDEHIAIRIITSDKPYKDQVNEFEKIMKEHEKSTAGIDGIFGIEYDNVKYGTNKFLYPAFAENKIHLITSRDKNINISSKEELKKYKGLYELQDKVSQKIEKDFTRYNISSIETYDKAFEELLTGRVDFVVASYYKSQIFLYEKGLRKYVNYSVNPLWKMPLFIKLSPKAISHSRIVYLKNYIKSQKYKTKRDEALEEMLNFYKENTKGVVPPTYIQTMQTQI